MEKSNVQDLIGATVLRGSGFSESSKVIGIYEAECIMPNGKLRWEDTAYNVITDLGANFMLNQTFGGTTNTLYFLGLISSVGYTGIPVAADTMSSHSSVNHVWVEAGNGSNYPLWTTPASNARVAVTWNAAATRSKAIASVASFSIAGTGGTVKGCFIVTGTGAVATNNDTNGTLFSSGVFTGGDKIVGVGDTLQVSYSVALS
jgi:hypothetical protein